MEMEVKIEFIPKEFTCEDKDMFRVSCKAFYYCGWGETLEEAIKNFDEENELK